MPAVAETTVSGVLTRINDLRPLIEKHSEETERECRVAEQVSEAMREAGMFRMLRPKEVGGLGLDPASCYRMIEEITSIDSAVGWNVAVANGFEPFGAWASEKIVEDLFGSEETVICGGFFPPRRAIPVDGGYRLSGRTSFNSNCHASTWVCGQAFIFESEDSAEPRLSDSGTPETLLTFFPINEAEIIENWNTLGMCGTGSHDVSVEDLFIREEYTAPFTPITDPPAAYSGPLHRLSVWSSIASVAAPAIGIARAAIEDFQKLGAKVPSYTANALGNRPVVQQQLGEAEAKLSSARALFQSTFDDLWQKALDGDYLDLGDRARCQVACSYAVQASAEAVDLIHLAAGSSSIRNEQRFQRHFRDIHVMTQHAFVSQSRYQSIGQIMLGQEPEWPFFAM